MNNKVLEIKEKYLPGTKIELLEMKGESQMPSGLTGVVTFVDDAGQIHVKWENFSGLALNVDVDEFNIVKNEDDKIKVLLVKPNCVPEVVEIDSSLEGMQKIVGGYIEELIPFNDEVAIVCNEEGKMNGCPLNRALYQQRQVDMSYEQLKELFENNEKNHLPEIKGYIVFKQENFSEPYTEEQRTYEVSSHNKAFMPDMGGFSIWGSNIAGDDTNVRLERYMKDCGISDGWEIERCYIYKESDEPFDIIAGNFFVCYAPSDSDHFQSLPDELLDKYMKKFERPETFSIDNNSVKVIKEKPVFTIPVEWTVSDTICVKGETFEEAIQWALEHLDEIPLGDDAEYIGGTYKISSEEDEAEKIAKELKELGYGCPEFIK